MTKTTNLFQRLAKQGLFIDASAGTGKTFTLTEGAMALVAEHHKSCQGQACQLANTALEGLLLMTFTNLAAGEMAERMRRRLLLALHGDQVKDPLVVLQVPSHCLGREWDALQASPPSTIHSTCLRLLGREFAKRGLPLPPTPSATKASDRVQELLRIWLEEATPGSPAQTLAELMFNHPQLITNKLVRDWGNSFAEFQAASPNPDHLKKTLEKIKNKDFAIDLDENFSFIAEETRRLYKLFDQASKAELTESDMNFNLDCEFWYALDNLKKRVDSNEGEPLDQNQALEVFRAVAELKNAGAGTRQKKKEGGWWIATGLSRFAGKDQFDKFKTFHIALHQKLIQPAQGLPLFFLKTPLLATMDCLHAFVEDVAAAGGLRDRHGLVGFDDLQTRFLRELMRPDGASAPRQLTNLWIDEFQDTDPIQAAITRQLLIKHDKDPRCTVVGDPKQSIYGFRGADVSQFLDFREHFLKADSVESLRVNFRSKEKLVDMARSLFTPEFFGSIKGGMEASPQLEASRKNIQDPFDRDPPAFLHVVKEKFPNLLAARKGCSELVSKRLTGWRSEGCSWGDLAVLYANNAIRPHLEEALNEAKIPYRVLGNTRFLEDLEWITFRQALRAIILRGHDWSSNAALIRAPFLDLPYRDFLESGLIEKRQAREQEQGFSPNNHLRRFLDQHQDKAGARAILDGLGRSGRDPLSIIARRLAAACGLDQWLHLTFGKSARAKQAEFQVMLSGLGALEQNGLTGLSLLDALDDEDQFEPRAPVLAGEDAVTLMTIHGSKGLEFKRVAVAGIHLQRPNKAGSHLALVGHQAADVNFENQLRLGLCISLTLNDGKTGQQQIKLGLPGWEGVKDIRKQRNQDERGRLLYVALTRARDDLYVPLLTAKSSSVFAADKALHDWALGQGLINGLSSEEFPESLQSGPTLKVQKNPDSPEALSSKVTPLPLRVSVTKLLQEAFPWQEKKEASAPGTGQVGLPSHMALAWGRTVHSALDILGPNLNDLQEEQLVEAVTHLIGFEPDLADFPQQSQKIQHLKNSWCLIKKRLGECSGIFHLELPILQSFENGTQFRKSHPGLWKAGLAALQQRSTETASPGVLDSTTLWETLAAMAEHREAEAGGKPMVLEGIADLVVTDENSGEVVAIFDFKTGSLTGHQEQYDLQLETYRIMLGAPKADLSTLSLDTVE